MYCSFLTFDDRRPAGLTPENYVDELLREIARRGEWFTALYGAQGRMVDSVFIGGGTPTFLESEALAEIVDALNQHFPIDTGNAEITTEANPDTLHGRSLERIAAAGVNRISIGVQATQEHHLRFLERTHRWKDIVPVLQSMKDGPIARYSFDMIYALPGMSTGEVRETARRLLELQPGHISAYELTVEPGTPLAKWARQFPGRIAEPHIVEEQQRAIARVCADFGYYRYEVSNYALPGSECYHNLRYWRGGDYIGLGLGSASRIGTEVINNPRELSSLTSQINATGSEDDPLQQAWTEQYAGGSADTHSDMFLKLRTPLGIELNGMRPPARWLERGYVRLHNGRMEVTARGMSFADTLAMGLEAEGE